MNIRNFDLNLILVFKELYQTMSVSQAAIRLGLSQPAVSHALSRLRASFDDELFIRSRRSLVPSEKALKLAPFILKYVQDLEDNLFQEDVFEPYCSNSLFTFSGTSYDSTIWFPGFLSDLKQESPHMRINFKGIVLDKYLERMREGLVDLSFAGDLTDIEGFTVETLGEWDMCIIAHKDSKKYKKKMTLESYLKAQHILYTPTETPGSSVDKMLKEMGFQRNVIVSTSYLNTIPLLVSKRDFLAIVPRFFANSVKEYYPIKVLEVPFDISSFKHQMVWHSSKNRSSEHEWLRNFIRENYTTWMKGKLIYE